ncbi:hypothetical protein M1D55_09975 [Cupriavidus sp. JZ107]
MLRSATFVRSLQRLLRLSLLPLLLALLPLHGWAGAGMPAGGVATHATESVEAAKAIDVVATIDTVLAGASDLLSATADPASDCGAPAPSPFADAGEAAPSGADLAEQLLLPSAPAMTDAGGRTGPPAYAALRLPEPDLPLLPRPPRG